MGNSAPIDVMDLRDVLDLLEAPENGMEDEIEALGARTVRHCRR